MNNIPEMMTISEVSKIFRIHPATVRRYVNDGKIKALRIGKHKLIFKSEIKNFIENCQSIDNNQQKSTNQEL